MLFCVVAGFLCFCFLGEGGERSIYDCSVSTCKISGLLFFSKRVREIMRERERARERKGEI